MANKENQMCGISANWAILHFSDSDPGSEFEIHPHTVIMAKKESLRAGLRVCVRYGKAKLHAEIVAVAETEGYLINNFASIKHNFIRQIIRRTTYPLKKRVKNYNPYEENQNVYNNPAPLDCLVRVIDPQITAVGAVSSSQNLNNNEEPNSTQTREWFFDERNREEAFNAYCNLQEDYLALKSNFDNLQQLYDRLQRSSIGQNSVMDVESQAENAPAPNVKCQPTIEEIIDDDSDMVYFGPNLTAIPKSVYSTINWLNCSAATRKLLVTVFSRDILATHTLTGKPSPAFLQAGKPNKQQLDSSRTLDIIQLVSFKCKVAPSMVRACITTKCADEFKMRKRRLAQEGKPDKGGKGSNKGKAVRGRKGGKGRYDFTSTSSDSSDDESVEVLSPRRTKRCTGDELQPPAKRILLE